MDLLDKTLGNYRIDRLLGEGGMGAVYQAHDLSLQRDVAIKLIHPHFARRAEFRKRFIQEARIMARLDHPGIIKVHVLGKEGDLLFLPMEYIRGGNLRQLLDECIRQRKWLPLREAVLLVCQLCQTVDYAHQHGVLHRDIKPANLMLKPEPTGELPFRVVLTDLGLAKLAEGLGITQEGTSLGTPAYMSPEQATGQPTDPRSDVYSLGILLYELTLGRLPFPIRSLTEATHYHTQVPPPTPRSIRPDLSEEFEKVTLKALEKDPSQRYSSAAELGAALAAGIIQDSAVATAVPMEIVESDNGQDTSLITEYEKSIIVDARPEETSLLTIFGSESMGPSGESVFGDESILPSPETRIQIVEKDSTARVLTLSSGTVTIGRDKNNHIVLADEKASRRHAQITWDGLEYHVMDLNSSNGTYLGNVRLLPGMSEILKPNQNLRIGDTWLRLIPPETRSSSVVSTRSMLDGSASFTRSTAGLVGVSVTPQQLSVEAGGSVTATVALINQSPNVDHFSLSPEGIPGAWVASLPARVHLMPGEQKETVFTIQVPRVHQSSAGPHPIKIKVTSERDPSQSVNVELVLTVEAYSHFEGELQPPRVRTGQIGNLLISNQGNHLEKFKIQFQDAANELTFQPPQIEVEVAAGKSAKKKFEAQLRDTRWIGGEKIHPFRASISLQKGERQTLHAEMLSRGLVPAWIPPIALLLCVSLVFAAYRFMTPILFPLPTLTSTPTPTITLSATLTPSVTPEPGAPVVEEWCVYLSSQPPSSSTDCVPQVSAQPGQSLTIQWRVSNADDVVINLFGNQDLSGSTSVSVTENMTSITLEASNAGKRIQKSVQINVVMPSGTPVPPTAVPPTRVPPTQAPPTRVPTNTPINTPSATLTPSSTAPPPVPREEFVDSNTQEQGMHACPAGFAIGVVHVGSNLFLCRRVMIQGEENHVEDFLSTPDNQQFRANMHVCPPGMYMRGLHVDNNWLLCSYDKRSQPPSEWTQEFEDRSSQEHNMHVCSQPPENISFLTGIHVSDNRFLCGILEE